MEQGRDETGGRPHRMGAAAAIKIGHQIKRSLCGCARVCVSVIVSMRDKKRKSQSECMCWCMHAYLYDCVYLCTFVTCHTDMCTV